MRSDLLEDPPVPGYDPGGQVGTTAGAAFWEMPLIARSLTLGGPAIVILR